MSIERTQLDDVIQMKFRHVIDAETAEIPTDVFYLLREAARQHLATLPKTKMVEVWRVEYAWTHAGEHVPVIAQYMSREMALSHERSLGSAASCIRVTGPHQQEIPA